MQVRLPEDDEMVSQSEELQQRLPKEDKERHTRLPEDDNEENLGNSARLQLNMTQQGNAEESLQLARSSEDISVREEGRKYEKTPLKYFLISGLAMVVIMILSYQLNQQITIDQTLQLEFKTVRERNETNRTNLPSLTITKLELKVKQSHGEPKDQSSIEQRQEKVQQVKESSVSSVNQKQQQNVILQKNPNLMSPPTHGNFLVPHFVWTYSEDPQSNNFFVRKCLDNMQYFAEKSSFMMTILNSRNYKAFLQPETVDKIADIIWMLKDRMKKQPKSNLKDHFQTIKKRLIAFHVLNENGGIFIEKNVLFTQSFEWLKEIEHNMHVNKGSGRVRARYFGFFNLDHSSHIQKHNKSGIAYEPEKYMVLFPTIEPYFLVAQANQAFLSETLTEYVDLLVNPTSFHQKMKNYNLYMEVLQGKDLYYEIFYTSQLIVLHRKQQDINSLGKSKFDDTFAIDQYGLLTMNERYFPKKLDFYFKNHSQEKIYWNLAKYALKEMEDMTGPMRYITCMTVQKHINYRIKKARERVEKYYINPQSFLGKFVINNSSQPYVLKEYEKSTVNPQGKSWDELPRIIWLYWDTGLKNSSIANKLCVDNIRRAAAQNNFQVRQLNDSNTAEYLGTELNERISSYIKNIKIKMFPQTKSDFVRIAIIAKYGGIYMDASYFSIKGLSWIINITQAPSETIFNRYGQMPRVLMFFHPHYGTAFDWTYDKQANTKKLMVSAYENNLLIAEPNQQLFWDWLEEYGRFITKSYEQTEQLMKDIGVLGIRWTSKNNMYLAAMDSIKNVIAKKNKAILDEISRDHNYKGSKSGAQFYGLWSVSGYREQQKFRAHTNFDNVYNSRSNNHNVFLWRYSDTYVQGLIGNISYLAKLYGWSIKQLNKFINYSYDSNFSDLHPHSYVAKYLYKPELHKFTKHDNQLFLEFVRL